MKLFLPLVLGHAVGLEEKHLRSVNPIRYTLIPAFNARRMTYCTVQMSTPTKCAAWRFRALGVSGIPIELPA
jgi:hypothetical protein